MAIVIYALAYLSAVVFSAGGGRFGRISRPKITLQIELKQ